MSPSRHFVALDLESALQAVELKPPLGSKPRLERKAQPEPFPGSVAQGLSSPRSRTNRMEPGCQGASDDIGFLWCSAKAGEHVLMGALSIGWFFIGPSGLH